MDGAGLIPAHEWDLSTRYSRPTAYRLSLPDIGGGKTVTALSGEVLHFRIGSTVDAPYAGVSPLRRARLTAGLMYTLESALSEIYDTAPIGTSVLPFPESPQVDLENMAREFRAKRGKILIRESVNVAAAGGPAPAQDWRPSDLSPDLQKAMMNQNLSAARDSVSAAYGILPAMNFPAATGPVIREGQRHLSQYVLQPLAAMIAQEASEKLEASIKIDTLRPLQSFDAGGRARAISAIIGALAQAKESGVDPAKAMQMVDWGNEFD
jgi:phage portal protein BeeE